MQLHVVKDCINLVGGMVRGVRVWSIISGREQQSIHLRRGPATKRRLHTLDAMRFGDRPTPMAKPPPRHFPPCHHRRSLPELPHEERPEEAGEPDGRTRLDPRVLRTWPSMNDRRQMSLLKRLTRSTSRGSLRMSEPPSPQPKFWVWWELDIEHVPNASNG